MKAGYTKGKFLEVRPYTRLMNWYRWQTFRLPFFNTLARFAMLTKFQLDKYRINSKNNIDVSSAKLNPEQLIFVLSTFRSGSTFLADFLSEELAFAQVAHESNVNDYWSYPKILRDEKFAEKYYREYRKSDLYQRLLPEKKMYIEFSPFMVLHGKALRIVLPGIKILHLVRNGRDVVRSLMAREVLGPKDPMLRIIQPPEDDPYFSVWRAMSRFEKICWKWQYENKLLREHADHIVQFEGLITDYAYFKEKLLTSIEFRAEQTHCGFKERKEKCIGEL